MEKTLGFKSRYEWWIGLVQKYAIKHGLTPAQTVDAIDDVNTLREFWMSSGETEDYIDHFRELD